MAEGDANAELLRNLRGSWERARDASAALIDVLDEASLPPSDAGLLIAVARASNTNTAPTRDAAFRDLQATGNLRVISDPDVRVAVVRYFAEQL